MVADRLRQEILRGRYTAGTTIVQSDIATAFGVSITPVREAIRHLASVGLLSVQAHRGAVVSGGTVDNALELQRLLLLLEPEVVRRSARHITEPDVQVLSGITNAMTGAAPETLADLADDFAATMFNAARAPRMVALVQSLRDRAVPAVEALHPSQPTGPNIIARHRLLVAALTGQEESRAADIVERHLAAVVAELEARRREMAPDTPASLAS